MHFQSQMLRNYKVFQGDQSHTNDDFECTDQISECPVYYPSVEDFEDPLQFIQQIAPQASKYGICKIVPHLISSTPTGVVMKKEKPGFRFTPKVKPLRVSRWTKDDKNSFFISRKSYTLRDFEVMANRVFANKYCLSGCLPSAYVEMEFWREMTHGKKGTVEYGVNVDGCAFSSSSDDHLANSKWNLKVLNRLPRSSLRLVENDIPGVTDPMMYIGMLFSMFAWHVEDHYLYSINYHHCGAPKTWYGVLGSAAHEFEKVTQHHVYSREILPFDGPDAAFEILAEKTTMFPPKVLLQNRVPVHKLVQLPGEFVVTFPRAYHAGFSHGFNCGDAVNFAAIDWFSFGEAANERYAFLRKKPVIPYEEIICKEAMFLPLETDADFNSFIKGPFASLMQKYNAFANMTVMWHMLTVNVMLIPCLFHDKELSACNCGRNHVLWVRGDLTKMKNLSKKFEKQLVHEAKKLLNHDSCVNKGHTEGVGGVEYVGTKIQENKSSKRESKRARKKRACSCGKVDVDTPVNRTGRRGRLGNSSKKQGRSGGGKPKNLKNKCRKKTCHCHLDSKICHNCM